MRRVLKCLSIALFLAIIIQYELRWLGVYQSPYHLSMETTSSEEFREMNFGENGLKQIIAFAKENELRLEDCVSVIMIVYDYDLSEFDKDQYTIQEYNSDYKQIKRFQNEAYSNLKSAYKKVIHDVDYFPIPCNDSNIVDLVNYVNSWGSERTYGGEHRHEGTDIMDNSNTRGKIPILSMTSGVVQNLGWLELGGYRIGIVSDSGGYYYYAHLYSYAPGLKEGDVVKAGQLIGFMGDTGYSKVEGTTGNFAVHLHFGIYITVGDEEEVSVNPYFILKNLESNTIEYDF